MIDFLLAWNVLLTLAMLGMALRSSGQRDAILRRLTNIDGPKGFLAQTRERLDGVDKQFADAVEAGDECERDLKAKVEANTLAHAGLVRELTDNQVLGSCQRIKAVAKVVGELQTRLATAEEAARTPHPDVALMSSKLRTTIERVEKLEKPKDTTTNTTTDYPELSAQMNAETTTGRRKSPAPKSTQSPKKPKR